jgi:thiol:disulfide interchange protein DsbC
MKPTKLWMLGCLAAGLSLGAAADEFEAELLAKLQRAVPAHRARIRSVRKLEGLPFYEVVASGNQIYYTDPKGSVLLVGNMFDLATLANLTDDRLEQLQVVDFSRLPLDKAIVRVRGDGSRKLAVFADPDCPFCKQLEQELLQVSNVTLYVFLYPLASLHPDAPRKARAIWCAPDPGAAWDQWILRETEPAKAPEGCADPIAEIAMLADTLNIDATPGLVFPSGRLIPGAVAAQDIEQNLNESAKP